MDGEEEEEDEEDDEDDDDDDDDDDSVDEEDEDCDFAMGLKEEVSFLFLHPNITLPVFKTFTNFLFLVAWC